MLGHPIYTSWRGVQNVESAKPFVRALRQGRFVLQVCADCGGTSSPARLHCQSCRSAKLVWRAAATSGKLVASTTYQKQYDHDYFRKVPYNVVLVKLDCGPMILGACDEPVSQSQIGALMQLDIVQSAAGFPLQFRLVRESGNG
ncbi:MAG: zinc ribbon domain-containing protein, partial [Caldisericota bacterium]|nr:zinc ribbon domain-containing protein [Caldisericota bacterium]